jgi:hypothetical protein
MYCADQRYPVAGALRCRGLGRDLTHSRACCFHNLTLLALSLGRHHCVTSYMVVLLSLFTPVKTMFRPRTPFSGFGSTVTNGASANALLAFKVATCFCQGHVIMHRECTTTIVYTSDFIEFIRAAVGLRGKQKKRVVFNGN